MKKWWLGIGNTYGHVNVIQDEHGFYYLAIDQWEASSPDVTLITEELGKMLIRELGREIK